MVFRLPSKYALLSTESFNYSTNAPYDHDTNISNYILSSVHYSGTAADTSNPNSSSPKRKRYNDNDLTKIMFRSDHENIARGVRFRGPAGMGSDSSLDGSERYWKF